MLEHPLIQQIAVQRGISPAQVLIAWGLSRDSIVLAQSVSPVHLQENFEAAEIELNSQELEAIADLEIHYRFVDGSFGQHLAHLTRLAIYGMNR